MESSLEIEERAAEWHAKRDSGNWTEDDQRRFDEWRNASTANRVAYIRQAAAWKHALRLQALRGGVPPGTVPSPENWRFSPFSSEQADSPDDEKGSSAEGEVSAQRRVRRWPSRALAASLLVAIVAGITWQLWPSGPSYRTAVGGIASVPMHDGSKITLNTDSEVRLAVTEKERRVNLEHGEAFFEVAHDPTRPFVVAAGNKRVIAVGTKFSVRRIDNDVRVFVTEGRVRIEEGSAPSLAPADRPRAVGSDSGTPEVPDATEMLVAAGGIARTGDAGIVVQQNAQPEIDDYLSWRSGYLVFRETPLADAVAEFNRYNEQKIVIRDPQVAAIRFSGKIRPTSSEPFIRLLEEAFPIHAEHLDGRIVLSDGRK